MLAQTRVITYVFADAEQTYTVDISFCSYVFILFLSLALHTKRVSL